MNKTLLNIFTARFFKQLKMSHVYISALIFTVFTAADFYLRHQFFNGSGSSDLVLYFSSIPFICIITIPLLCFKTSFSFYDDFIPLTGLQKLLINYSGLLLIYIANLILIIPGLLLVNLFGTIEVSQLLVCLLCLIFYGSSVIALCILISKIFNSTVISLLVSILILALFNSCHLFTLYVSLPSFIESFLREISFAWHFDAAGKSIIDTRDIIYFLMTDAIFITLAILIENLKKGKVFSFKNKFSYFVKLAVFFLVILNSNKYYKRIDVSKNKTYTPSLFSKELISSISDSVKITYYCSSSLSRLYPQIRDVKDFLTSYSILGKDISFIIKDPDKDNEIKNLLQNMGIQSQQLRSVSENSTEFTAVYSAIVIEYQGNTEVIPFIMSASSLEYDLAGRLIHLLSQTVRNVNIIIGNGMSLSTDYDYIEPWLSSQGFVCNEINIYQNDFEDALLHLNGPLLIIGDGNIPIEKAVAIESYIMEKRGNALFAVSPYKSDIENSWYISQSRYTNIVELAENWGVLFKPEIAADVSCARISMYSDDNTDSYVINYPQWISLLPQENALSGLVLYWSTPLELSGIAEPYLVTSPASYSYKLDFDSPENLLQTNPFLLEEQNKSDFEYKTQVVGARIKGKVPRLYTAGSDEEIEVIVIPDQYFLNTLMNGYTGNDTGDFRNFSFLTNALLKLNGEEELAKLQSKTTRDTTLYKIQDQNELLKLKTLVFIILFAVIPLIIIAGGFVAFFKTKKLK